MAYFYENPQIVNNQPHPHSPTQDPTVQLLNRAPVLPVPLGSRALAESGAQSALLEPTVLKVCDLDIFKCF